MKRIFLVCVLSMASWPGLFGAEPASPGETSPVAKRPNIVVFLSDDHGQLDSTPYGATDVTTPNMQKLADGGMTFTRAFIASPACAPSRAALLTGMMPARNGAEANHTYKRDDVAPLPAVLQRQGYETAAFGKVAHKTTDAARYGFDKIDGRADAKVVEAFLESRDQTKPLCLFVGTHEPHVPWPDSEGYSPTEVKLPPTFIDTPETRQLRARYYSDVTKADTLLGKIRELTTKKLGPDSLWIYSSDHGAQWPFGKWNLYDAGIRVPLIVAWPGVITPGSRSDAMVQWTDLLPTLIDVAGGSLPDPSGPDRLDGRSFLPVLLGKTTKHRSEIFTTHSGDGNMNIYPIRSIRTGEWKLILNLHPEYAYTTHIDRTLREDSSRYWISWHDLAQNDTAAAAVVKRYHERPAIELYNLRIDPLEQQNLAADPAQAEHVRELRSRLREWMRAQGDQETVFNPPRLLADPASTRLTLPPGVRRQN